MPDELKKKKIRNRGEASLRGHLKGEAKEERSGSSSYVPKEREKDEQLNYAIAFLKGTVSAKAEALAAPSKAKTKAN